LNSKRTGCDDRRAASGQWVEQRCAYRLRASSLLRWVPFALVAQHDRGAVVVGGGDGAERVAERGEALLCTLDEQSHNLPLWGTDS
jgi:hypothetical protein